MTDQVSLYVVQVSQWRDMWDDFALSVKLLTVVIRRPDTNNAQAMIPTFPVIFYSHIWTNWCHNSAPPDTCGFPHEPVWHLSLLYFTLQWLSTLVTHKWVTCQEKVKLLGHIFDTTGNQRVDKWIRQLGITSHHINNAAIWYWNTLSASIHYFVYIDRHSLKLIGVWNRTRIQGGQVSVTLSHISMHIPIMTAPHNVLTDLIKLGNGALFNLLETYSHSSDDWCWPSRFVEASVWSVRRSYWPHWKQSENSCEKRF